MADRVKYFLLGLLFLVVAGVIAFDRWNSRDAVGPADTSARSQDGEGQIWFDPPNRDEEELEEDLPPISIIPPVDEDEESGRELIPPPPEPRPKPTPKPDPGPKPNTNSNQIHVVQSGETLGEIAARYYPGRVQSGIRLIVRANQIANPNRIREKDKLVIPASKVRAPTRTPVLEPPAKRKRSNGIPSVYTVKKNDGDLYTISRKFYGRSGEGARVVRIMEMNSLVSTRVKAGTKLKLPKK
ncbi:MAG: LysM peptidoglycan-binding domain-containing protein [Planctomycetota bacterium]|jgi:LysM repeat protein